MNRSVSGITESNKRSIRDIKRQRSRQEGRGQRGEGGDGAQNGNHRSQNESPAPRNSNKTTTYGLWFVGLVGILFLFFLFSVVFAETVVTVSPKTADISIDQELTASNDPATPGVGFSAVSVNEQVSLSATSSGSEYREGAASGQITVYNEFGNESIRLVPSTRFATAEGKIYRTTEAITVPAQESDGTPGTVTAQVTADEVGEDYNTDAGAEFSIPGFEGTVYDEVVYAESLGGITGGVAGNIAILASSTEAELRAEADTQLRAQLEEKLARELPEGFFLYPDAGFFSSEITASEDIAASTSELTVTGTLQGVAFNQSRLSDYVARAFSDDISEDADVLIQDIADFEFAFVEREEFTPGESDVFSFSLSGDSRIIWQFDERGLVRDLRGLEKSQLSEVLENYPGIQSAQIETRPFWKQTLPGDAADIDIETVVR